MGKMRSLVAAPCTGSHIWLREEISLLALGHRPTTCSRSQASARKGIPAWGYGRTSSGGWDSRQTTA